MANTLYDTPTGSNKFDPLDYLFTSIKKVDNALEPVRIYFIQSESGEIKIGYSCNVSNRLRDLQSSNPKKLYILRIIPGTKNLEIALLAKFSKYKIQGEWFHPAKEIFDFIEPRFLIIPEVGTRFSDLRKTPFDKKIVKRRTRNKNGTIFIWPEKGNPVPLDFVDILP